MAAIGVEGGAIGIGSKVVLKGLVARAHLNGSSGIVIAFHAERGRFAVQVDGHINQLALRPVNLQPMVEAPILWLAIPEDAPTAEIAEIAVQGLRTVADTTGYVFVNAFDSSGRTIPSSRIPPPPPGLLWWCKVKKATKAASESSSDDHLCSEYHLVDMTKMDDGRIFTNIISFTANPDPGSVPRLSTKENDKICMFAKLQVLACGLERGELPTMPRAVETAVQVLTQSRHHALPSARALLLLSIPIVEAAAGGPSEASVRLRYLLGEVCEELRDHDGAIKAYQGIASECKDLLQPAHLILRRPGLQHALSSEAIFAALGLAYKRAARYDLAEETYRDALRGVRADDLSEASQTLRWNLCILLKESAPMQKEEIFDAAMALFGGYDAASKKLMAAIISRRCSEPMLVHATDVQPDVMLRLDCLELGRQRAVFRPRQDDGAPVGPCLVYRNGTCQITVTDIPPSDEEKFDSSRLVSFGGGKESIERFVTCDACSNSFLRNAGYRCPCRLAFYCGKDCQKRHWADHKKAHKKALGQ